MKLFLKILAPVLVVAFLVWYFWLDLSLWAFSQTQENISQYIQQTEQDFRKYYPQMLIDAKTMEEIPVFHPLTYTKDASEFLNPMVSWTSEQNPYDPEKPEDYALKLNPELVAALKADKDFAKIKIDWSKYKLDFSWFKKIQDYDHWSYTQNAPYSKNETNFSVMTAPNPNYPELTRWVMVYLLYSRDFKQLKANSKDIDHLAKLIFSHQNYLNALVAVQILKIKRGFHESLSEAEQKQMQGVLLSDETITAIKRFVSAFAGMYSILTPDEVFNNMRMIKIGNCLMLEESFFMNADLKFLFSISYPDAIMRIDQMKQQSVSWCPETYAKRAWDSQSYQDRLAKTNPFELTQGINTVSINDTTTTTKSTAKTTEQHEDKAAKSDVTLADIAKNPKKAKAIADILLSVGSPDPFRMYKKE